MLITLFRHIVFYQSVSKIQLTGVAPLGAAKDTFNLIHIDMEHNIPLFFIILIYTCPTDIRTPTLIILDFGIHMNHHEGNYSHKHNYIMY